MATVDDPRRRRFPADIEAEILLRLPVKTLIRFKIACKQWSSLISSPQFQKSHHRHSQHNPPLLLTLHSEEFEENVETVRLSNNVIFHIANFSKFLRQSAFNADHLTLVNNFSKTLTHPLFDDSTFMQSCMGLVCIASGSSFIPPILICNPSTRDLITLPHTEEYNVLVGFGYVPSTHQFKVVRFFDEKNMDGGGCQVFTLGTTHWRKAESLPYRACEGTAPFLHGAVHCLPQICYRDVQETDIIVAFDIDTEQYTKHIPLPAFGRTFECHIILDSKNLMCLTILGGFLCLTLDYRELNCLLELWLLKDYNNAQWVKGYTIDVSSVYPYPSDSFWAYLADNMVDESILLNCSDEKGAKLLAYDPQNGRVMVKKAKERAATFYEETLYSLRC